MKILQLLEDVDINISNCRAQTYDNASNMSGKYSGLQARIKEVCNLSVYVPCARHSLNLVGENSVSECIDAVNFFGILQRLYSFFVASTHRWNILVENKGAKVTNLSDTRWSCRVDAVNDAVKDYDGIHNALLVLENDVN